jgi:serine/threonine-protein kinase
MLAFTAPPLHVGRHVPTLRPPEHRPNAAGATTMIDRLNEALTGRYEIERDLGEGGMATVYLAKDVKHNRPVAVKVLKPELAAVVGADRFLAEIETTANLQHPHILPLFDSGQADGFLFYVMPYVEGETLADRIARDKQLPVDEALGIATSVAAALQVAHEAGIVHRDIKPANILLSRGEPLVADFGIALAVGAGGTRLTETGLSVGTPFYMSPEQATGDQIVGPSADIYALGCVLYEMLVGEPPYLGNTAQAVLGKIIQGLPVSATAARRSIPFNVDSAIRKALEKLPADRFTKAADFARALSDGGFRYGEAAGAATGLSTGPAWKGYVWPAVAVLAGLAAVGGWLKPEAVEQARIERYRINLPGFEGQAPMWFGSIARDGSALAFFAADEQGGVRIFTKESEDPDPAPVRGLSTQDLGYTAFSPDGTQIAVATFRGQLLKVGRSAGSSTVLVDVFAGPLTWLEGGTIVVGTPGKLVRVSQDGGVIDEIALSDPTFQVTHVAPLPGERGFLFVESAGFAADALWVYDARAGQTKLLSDGVSAAWYGEPGLLVMSETGGGNAVSAEASTTAARFNLKTLEIEGPRVGLTEPILQAQAYPMMLLSENGTLVYEVASGNLTGGFSLVWVDRAGSESDVDANFAFSAMNNGGMRLSPDGSRVALNQGELTSGSNVFVKGLPDGPATKVTFTDTGARRPTWSPDGASILYIAPGPGGREGLWQVRADGVGSATLLLERERAIFEGLWSPDGEWLVYRTDDEGDAGRGDIMGLRPGVDSVPISLVARSAEETSPTISPDGRWIAFASTEQGGQKQIFVRPFPNVDDGRWQVSTDGGIEPAWSPDGSELFFWSGLGASQMKVARVEATAGFTVRSVETLGTNGASYLKNDDHRWYDVSPDGERFLMVRASSGAGVRLVLARNFFEVVRRGLGG